MKRGHLIILLIENDENDVFFFEAASKRSRGGHMIRAVRDGQEAIRYLRGEGDFADRRRFPIPNIVLSDLKMPGLDGFGFLQWIRNHPECSVIPIIIFSSSALEADVREAYRLGASSFMTKPLGIESLVELLDSIYAYWSRCECPPFPGSS